MELNKVTSHISYFYGLEVKDIEMIKKGVTNDNYKINSGNESFVFKIYNFKTNSEVNEEVMLLSKLSEHNYPSPRLLSENTGVFVGEYNGKPCIMYSFIGGVISDKWSNSALFQIGTLLGQMHVLLAELKPGKRRFTRDYEAMKKFARSGAKRFYDAHYDGADKLLNFVESELNSISIPDDLPLGYTHEDVKPENVLLINDNVVGILDFDLLYYGALLSDITTTIIWACFAKEEIDTERTETFISGYQSERLLSNAERKCFLNYIHFRLVREAFMSPYDVLPLNMNITKPRSDAFIKTAEKFKSMKNSLGLSFLK